MKAVTNVSNADEPGYDGIIERRCERILWVVIDVEEDELEEWTSTSEDVVVQPDCTWTHTVRVEHLGEVMASA